MNIISLFSGCGGLDLGFQEAGFNVVWANDSAKSVWRTYQENHPHTTFCTKSIRQIKSSEIPNDIVGVVGGPPCQSWSNAGKGKGLEDSRGALFHEFVRVLSDKNPLFFVAENVEGMLSKRHAKGLEVVKDILANAGMKYELSVVLLSAADYGVAQNRKRVFFVGYRKDLNISFSKPNESAIKSTVKSAIYDLKETAIPGKKANKSNGQKCAVANHEYWTGDYSYIFMSRNRVLDWAGQSYTIQASGRQVSIHPQAPAMQKVKKDVMRFVPNKKKLYRRLTIRECARIQTFPDDFIFYYDSLNAGYQMVGNAVPVNLANAVARQIKQDIKSVPSLKKNISQINGRYVANTVLKQPSSVPV